MVMVCSASLVAVVKTMLKQRIEQEKKAFARSVKLSENEKGGDCHERAAVKRAREVIRAVAREPCHILMRERVDDLCRFGSVRCVRLQSGI